MDKQILSIGLKVLLSLILCFGVQYAILTYFDFSDSLKSLGYSLQGFYGFELIFTIVMLLAMFGIKNSLPEQLGFVFLGFITLRLVASYLFAANGLDHEDTTGAFKYNFLLIILVFLVGDAFIAYRILNK